LTTFSAVKTFAHNGVAHRLEYRDADSFDELDYGKCRQVYGVCLYAYKEVAFFAMPWSVGRRWALDKRRVGHAAYSGGRKRRRPLDMHGVTASGGGRRGATCRSPGGWRCEFNLVGGRGAT
jgi:hypothetical protein